MKRPRNGFPGSSKKPFAGLEPRIPRNPCEEFRVYITAQTDDDFPYVLKYAGDDNIVIGTDYGHTDASSEVDAIEVFRGNHEVSDAVKKKILADNPCALYAI